MTRWLHVPVSGAFYNRTKSLCDGFGTPADRLAEVTCPKCKALIGVPTRAASEYEWGPWGDDLAKVPPFRWPDEPDDGRPILSPEATAAFFGDTWPEVTR